MLRKIVTAAARLGSFADAAFGVSVCDVTISPRHVQQLTHEVGTAITAARDAAATSTAPERATSGNAVPSRPTTNYGCRISVSRYSKVSRPDCGGRRGPCRRCRQANAVLEEKVAKLEKRADETERPLERLSVLEGQQAEMMIAKAEADNRQWQLVYSVAGAVASLLVSVVVQLVLTWVKT